MQLCGWIVNEDLWVGGVSDTEYNKHAGFHPSWRASLVGGGLDSTRLPAAAVGLGGWPLSHSPSVVEGNLGSGMVIRRGVGWRGRAPLVGHRDGGGGGGMDDGAAEVRADPHRRVWQQPGQAPSACVRPN